MKNIQLVHVDQYFLWMMQRKWTGLRKAACRCFEFQTDPIVMWVCTKYSVGSQRQYLFWMMQGKSADANQKAVVTKIKQ